MQEIAEWLDRLGLSEYVQRFAENDIDASVLPHLTDENLKELGISFGHRVKLLAAIRELSVTTPAAPAAATSAEPKPKDMAERRQVTVMFSDLVGSTVLSARMDPEDLREIISAYQKCVAETVQRFGGFVAKYMGDGVLIYFGYPRAHEHDAERAVRAGLELVRAVTGLKSRTTLQTRVGIATRGSTEPPPTQTCSPHECRLGGFLSILFHDLIDVFIRGREAKVFSHWGSLSKHISDLPPFFYLCKCKHIARLQIK
jgi:SAM domain (Sterile alpha motif)/Adenylate and Guanylate cyclase catalytic domain